MAGAPPAPHGGIGSGCSFALWVLGILVILWLVWYFTGGPAHFEATHGPFINPPAPLDNGQVYGPNVR